MKNNTIYKGKIVAEASKIVSLAIELTSFYGIQVFANFSAHVNHIDICYHENNDWSNDESKVVLFDGYISSEYWGTEQYKITYNKILNARKQLEELKKK